MLTDQFNRHDLKEWRKTRDFFCPQCSSRLNLKVGEIIIPHFAHQTDASCINTFSEGESPQHLLGKQLLYAMLKRTVETVEMEPYIPELAQRPDLLVTHRSHQIPIEFQCSTIPTSLVHNRTAGYKTNGMYPLWILCTPSRLKDLPEAVNVMQLSRFHESFLIPSSPEGPLLLTFDPHTGRFNYYSSLLHIAGKRYIGMHRTLHTSSQTFPFAMPKSLTVNEITRYYESYTATRESFLNSCISLNRKGINHSFLRTCYEMRIRPSEMPNWIGIPVRYNAAFRENDCEWQLALLRFMKVHNLKFKTLTDTQIDTFIYSSSEPTTMKTKACIAYRDFMNSLTKEEYSFRDVIDPSLIVKVLADRFLAK